MTAEDSLNISIGSRELFRIVFAGEFGVGKTTALKQISQTPISSGEVESLELRENHLKEGKTSTTVGYDYGEIGLTGGVYVSLIGLPGQERFEDMWDILLKTHAGVVLWIYGNHRNMLQECRKWLEILQRRDAVDHLCVVVTRLAPEEEQLRLEHVAKLVAEFNPRAHVMAGDPREKNDVVQAVGKALDIAAKS